MKTSKALILVAALATSSILFPMTAQAQRLIGGIDVDKYCRDRFGEGSKSELVENTAWGWRCRIRQDLVSLSMDNACRFQYKNQNAYARPHNERDPYSWQCFVN
jgi:hypothetical protein